MLVDETKNETSSRETGCLRGGKDSKPVRETSPPLARRVRIRRRGSKQRSAAARAETTQGKDTTMVPKRQRADGFNCVSNWQRNRELSRQWLETLEKNIPAGQTFCTLLGGVSPLGVSAVGRRSWLPFWEGTLCLIVDPPTSPFWSVHFLFLCTVQYGFQLVCHSFFYWSRSVSGRVLIWLRIA